MTKLRKFSKKKSEATQHAVEKQDDSDDPTDGEDELRRVNKMMTDLGPHGLLLPAEAATLLRIPVKKIYDMPLPKVRIGLRRIRYQVKHLRSYLNENTEDPLRHR